MLHKYLFAIALSALSALALILSAGAMTAQAATVTSTIHYQKQINLSACDNLSCSGSFPSVPLKHQLNVTRMSCYLLASADSIFNLGSVRLENAQQSDLLDEFLPAGSSAGNGYHTINQPVDLQAAATQHIVVYMTLASGTPNSGICTATGTMDTLQ